ncbi:MAG TPA: DUF6519 domain-containing protein [Burkholderiaceae bacterium]|nr:DUF6519 domain-containing protein [Burkholderiaceae bacterium]
MKGDFSRDSFDPVQHYSRVLLQQGRVELDADANERQSIQLHLLRTLAADLIGPYGGPGTGFEGRDRFDGQQDPLKGDFVIAKGHYYVDGWLCENDKDVHFSGQPWWQPPADALQPNRTYLAYLDVWERHVTAVEADFGRAGRATTLREVALGGPDTATRAQVVWQVKVSLCEGLEALPQLPLTNANWPNWRDANWTTLQAQWQPPARGQLRASVSEPAATAIDGACVASPTARYRGLENQLYRVEVHHSGWADSNPPATFVWSRENGSVLFGIAGIAGASVRLAQGWRDARFGIVAGDIVEISDDRMLTTDAVGELRRVTAVDLDTLTISVDRAVGNVQASRRAIVRRWDHGQRAGEGGRAPIAKDGALTISEGVWLRLEDGLSIRFDPAAAGMGRQHYRSGDYWLIPARVATGDILWPRADDGKAEAVRPDGIVHHYAPLAVVKVGADGKVEVDSYPARQ